MESFAIQCTLIGGDINAEAKDPTMTVDLKNKKFAGMTLKDMAKKLKAPIQESGEENRKAQPLISSTSFIQKGVGGAFIHSEERQIGKRIGLWQAKTDELSKVGFIVHAR